MEKGGSFCGGWGVFGNRKKGWGLYTFYTVGSEKSGIAADDRGEKARVFRVNFGASYRSSSGQKVRFCRAGLFVCCGGKSRGIEGGGNGAVTGRSSGAAVIGREQGKRLVRRIYGGENVVGNGIESGS